MKHLFRWLFNRKYRRNVVCIIVEWPNMSYLNHKAHFTRNREAATLYQYRNAVRYCEKRFPRSWKNKTIYIQEV